MTAAAAAVLLLHGLLLHGIVRLGLPASGVAAQLPAPPPLQVRQILSTSSAFLALSPAASPVVPRAQPMPADAGARPAVKRLPPSLPPRVPPDFPPQSPLSPLSPLSRAAAQAEAANIAAPTTVAPPNPANTVPTESAVAMENDAAGEQQDALVAPLYATEPAPAATLSYQLQRGQVQGRTQLRWQPQVEQYRLQLQFEVLGLAQAGWSSAGRFDAHGLAPDRYSELRRAREVRATNFQRDTQTLSFSAQGAVLPLPGGIQDRSSWMLQLGAVLQANPGLAAVGSQVTLPVVGTRGRPETWTFTVVHRGRLDTPAGPVADAVQLVREPRRPYDTRVTVWLDRARHHLPVELHLAVHGTGEGQHWRLQHLQWD